MRQKTLPLIVLLLVAQGVLLSWGLNAQSPVPIHPQREVDMSWFKESKYGLFIHWGLYSLAAGEWKGEPVAEFFQWQKKIPCAQMRQFAWGFNPTQFDADAWVQYAVDGGMKYLVITTKHSEGFSIFDSPSSDYNIMKMTPLGRDPIRELSEACQRKGILFCVYYSLGRDWADPDVPSNWPYIGGRSNNWDWPDEENKRFSRYFERKVKPQIYELLTQYKVHMLWFDVHGFCSPAESKELLDYIEELSPGCLVNDRIGNGYGDFFTPEQEIPPQIVREPWESCITMGTNWGYLTRDTLYKSPEVIVRLLTDVVAKGGNLLFNVGPTPQGTFPDQAVAHLNQVGAWLRVNGEAIYGTEPWRVYGEEAAPEQHEALTTEGKHDEQKDQTAKGTAPDLRFTSRPNVLYVMARSWDSSSVEVGDVLLTPREQIKKVTLLGHTGAVSYTQQGRSLTLTMPRLSSEPQIPIYVFKVELSTQDS